MLPLSEDPRFPTLMQKPGMTTEVCNLSSGAGGGARGIPAAFWPDSAVIQNKGGKFYISAVTVQTEEKGYRRSRPCSSQWDRSHRAGTSHLRRSISSFLATTPFRGSACQLSFPPDFLSRQSSWKSKWEPPTEDGSGEQGRQPLASVHTSVHTYTHSAYTPKYKINENQLDSYEVLLPRIMIGD